MACKYTNTKDYVEKNLEEVCEGEGLTVEEIIYFVLCLCPMFSCLWVYEQIDGPRFHALANRWYTFSCISK